MENLVMYGKDFKKETVKSEPGECKVEQIGNALYFYFTNSAGDNIVMRFNSVKKETYAKIAEQVWPIIDNNFQLTKTNKVYIAPSIYWDIYKRVREGKNFLSNSGKTLTINDRQYWFCETKDYFSDVDIVNGGKVYKGVYGIYYDDKLLYIGSSISNVKERWSQHYEDFKEMNSQKNRMYGTIKDYDNIRFELLFDVWDVNVKAGDWFIQLIESILIKILKPEFNIEGKDKFFNFTTSSGYYFIADVPYSYKELIHRYMTGGENDDLRKAIEDADRILEEQGIVEEQDYNRYRRGLLERGLFDE